MDAIVHAMESAALLASDLARYLATVRPASAADREVVNSLVGRLRSPEFEIREEATNRLLELGEPALEILAGRPEEEDLEAAMRVRGILEELTRLHDLAGVEGR